MGKNKSINETDSFWKIRAAKYDKLYWTKDNNYLSEIVNLGDLKKHHLALDVGTGTGAIAGSINKYVRHVVAIDTSNDMLEKGNWTGISTVKWNIGDSIFIDSTFHRVFARMVSHHILDNLGRAIIRCYDLLKDRGKIIVAEGVPRSNDPDVLELR